MWQVQTDETDLQQGFGKQTEGRQICKVRFLLLFIEKRQDAP